MAIRYSMMTILMVLLVVFGSSLNTAQSADPDRLKRLEALGEELFFDSNLSLNRTQSCASCHSPDYAFADPRGMGSPGDDGISIGDRNAPTLSYAAFIPHFAPNEKGEWKGGLFHDGRASSLEEQAGGPIRNPVEMGMPDDASVLERLKENDQYRAVFPALFGDSVFSDPQKAMSSITQAIGAFERRAEFSPFDSRYDRFLRGEVELTSDEELGRVLFFSQQFTNCNLCHQLSKSAIDPRETFTNYSYHNIGVPENIDLRAMNGVEPGTPDLGLMENPAVGDDQEQAGKFRTPTLRNVAITAPYMHNGVFEDLRTVILFYNQFNTKSEKRRINPETGQPFRSPLIDHSLSLEELSHGPALDDKRVDALVAFLKTLTDERYEYLLED